MSYFNNAVGTIGRGLARTANNEPVDATGFDIGGTLNFLFGNGQATGGANLSDLTTKLNNSGISFPVTAAELTYLQQSVVLQQQMIADIGTQLTSVCEVIASLNLEVQNAGKALSGTAPQQYQSWQAADLTSGPSILFIQNAYITYAGYISDYSGTSASVVVALQNNILTANKGMAVALNTISGLILDGPKTPGLLQLWSNMVCSLVNQGQMDYRDAVNQYMQYYQKLALAELTATNLLMEAYNMSGNVKASINAYTTYKGIVLAQENTFIQWLMPIINAGVTGSYTTADSGQVYNVMAGTHACMQLNPNFYTLPNSLAYYSPSPVLYDAEKLLQSLYCTDEADRRIVLHMLYFTQPQFSGLVQSVNLSLTSCSDETIIVNPVSSGTLGPISTSEPAGSSYPDNNWDALTLSYYVKRFVFSTGKGGNTLPDDTYMITNINNQGNLVPIATYVSATFENYSSTPFMRTEVLSHQLTANEYSTFDFMNFLAYNCPYQAWA